MLLQVVELPLGSIHTDETRREPGQRLIESLRKYGLFEPIHVRRQADGSYQLIDGSRRLAAGRGLGWETITALIEPPAVPGQPKDLQAIVVNSQRQNLRQLHLARHARRLIDQGAFTQTELARELHLSKGTLSSMLKVLTFQDLVAAIEDEGLEFSAARRLSTLSSQARAALLAEFREIQAQTGRFPSVREVEEFVRIRQGKAALNPVVADTLTLLAWECEERGVPVETRAAHGKQTHLRVVLTVAEDDEEWVQAVLAAPQDAGAPASSARAS